MKVGKMEAEAFADSLTYPKEGLLPVVAIDSDGGKVLMLAYANKEAVKRTLASGYAHFYSRSRGRLWKKGEESGNLMRVKAAYSDCDNDSLVYEVEVLGEGNACHLARKSCFVRKFGTRRGRLSVAELSAIIDGRLASGAKGSYTRKLASSRKLACEKITEEAAELVEALQKKSKGEVAWEACDLIYHSLVAARARGVRLEDLEVEFARRREAKGKP